MSATVAAIAKKVAVYLATDKRTWKAVGTIIGIAIAIVLLPVMLLLAMGNQLSSAETQSIDYSDLRAESLCPAVVAAFSDGIGRNSHCGCADETEPKKSNRESTDAVSHLF